MKFKWQGVWSDGLPRPMVLCRFRRGPTGPGQPYDVWALIDTGADFTTLPFQLASLIGFSTAELERTDCNGLGGLTSLWRPIPGSAALEVKIVEHGQWLAIPSLYFSDNAPPLLGRDFIFRNYKLRMEQGETDLRPLAAD